MRNPMPERPAIISAATRTIHVIPMPTVAPVMMDGSVPGKTIFQKMSLRRAPSDSAARCSDRSTL